MVVCVLKVSVTSWIKLVCLPKVCTQAQQHILRRYFNHDNIAKYLNQDFLNFPFALHMVKKTDKKYYTSLY